MTVKSKIDNIHVEDDFRICPSCKYDRGFHVSFLKGESERQNYNIILICPECGARYNVDWKINFYNEKSKR